MRIRTSPLYKDIATTRYEDISTLRYKDTMISPLNYSLNVLENKYKVKLRRLEKRKRYIVLL
jgi:hypothetical protein